MKMGEDTVAGVQKLISELHCKVSLSLDAWTSSNGHAFLAIVMHYISNDWRVEELLIDFREIQGEHSGANMGQAVWETVQLYGLKGRIVAIVMDNTTNNDTLVEYLEQHFKVEDIPFEARWACMRCMPHTTHLAALKLLEGVGVISPSHSRKATYQESVTAPLSCECDDDDLPEHDMEEEESSVENLNGIHSAIEKLRKIVKAVRSSPQRRQAWLNEVTISLRQTESTLKRALMLILDVKTRWSSTHQMLRQALDHRGIIDDFVAKTKELRHLELSADDWEAIALVTQWLKTFRSATTQMSSTKHSMLSSTHAIFRGLQESVHDFIKDLPSDSPPHLRVALLNCHRKLSDYYYKFDESPYYVWAGFLDPRISYDGLQVDADGDPSALDHIIHAKANLQEYYLSNYAKKSSVPLQMQPTSTTSRSGSPQKVDFLSRYNKLSRTNIDELEEYFKMPQENFGTCDPIQWWHGRRMQFPNLSRLARDILAIPGSAVAVERVFFQVDVTRSLCVVLA